MNLNDLIDRVCTRTGRHPKRSGKNYSARCPAHDDHNPSLSLSEGEDGKLLMHCHAGCKVENICDALEITTRDLFPNKNTSSKDSNPITTEYIYRRCDGVPLYKKIRQEPGANGKKKDFRILSRSEVGSWSFGLKEKARVLYQLPDVIEATKEGKDIYIVEGEKDAERLLMEELTATTPIEGAGSALRKEYAEQLKGANVVLLYDEDRAGHLRRDQWISLLTGTVKSLRVVALPDLEFQENHGQDVSDWFLAGHSINHLLRIVAETPMTDLSQIKTKKVTLVSANFQEFLSLDFPPRELILSPILPTQGIAMLYAKPGVGKTFTALGMGYAVATGGALLRWVAPKPRKVLYLDGEMPAKTIQERLRLFSLSAGRELPDPSYFRLITPDLQPLGMPDIATYRGQYLVEEVMGDAELIIFDNLSCLAREIQENEADGWAPVQEWALKLRRKGVSILFIHHAGKSGKQRGTSRREDILDTIIALRRPPDYQAEQGAKFVVSYEKSRGFYGKDTEPFSAEITVDEKTGISWKELDIVDDFYNEVVDLVKIKKPYRDIASQLGISKSKVESTVKRARDLKDLN